MEKLEGEQVENERAGLSNIRAKIGRKSLYPPQSDFTLDLRGRTTVSRNAQQLFSVQCHFKLQQYHIDYSIEWQKNDSSFANK